MRYALVSFFFLLSFLWCGELEKALEKPKVDIPSSVSMVLENYDKQMNVEKQKYLNIVLKMQKDLKVRLENEIKIAEKNNKDDLVVVLTEKKKQLEEDSVDESGFISLGFPGEAKKLTRKMLDDLLSSKNWTFSGWQDHRIVFKKGFMNVYIKGMEKKENNGTIKDKITMERASWWADSSYLIDVEKQEVVIKTVRRTPSFLIFSFSSEKRLVCKEDSSLSMEPTLDPTPFPGMVLTSPKK